MNVAGQLLTAATVEAGAAGLAGIIAPQRLRPTVVGCGTAAASATALGAALIVLAGGAVPVRTVANLLPLAGARFALDPLGALFVAATAIVAIPASIYSIAYTRNTLQARSMQAVWPVFVLSLILVPAAASVSTFLVLWELMALSSLVLVLAEHRHRTEVASAGTWYAVMTHLGLVAILAGLAWFASQVGGESFAALRHGAATMPGGVRSGVFMLTLIGFGSKAGAVPLHVWLPRAHPEAPSHVSALMSGAMVKLGVYGIVRVGWDLLGGGPRWWGLTVLGIGLASALFGILHALVASDLKRLLAYSTTENIGLILIGIGAAGVYSATGNRTLAAVAMAAALLHVVNHAAFKGLLFLGAGSVLAATGTRDLDRLGGLVRRMPVTAATFAVGALAISALPPLNGFVSEWLLFQALVHGLPSSSAFVVIVMPLAVSVVALTGGLAAATFVKAFGTGFLAMPRSNEAADAVEQPTAMLVGLVGLAGACVALGIGPSLLSSPLGRAVGALRIDGRRPLGVHGLDLRIARATGSLSPFLLATALVVGSVMVLVALRAIRSPRQRRVAPSWGCGRSVQTARMEYTATSFAEPLQRVFDDVLRPDLDVDVTQGVESRYFIEAVRYRLGIRDAFETRMYRPIIRAARWWGTYARRVQNGSIHRYLTYALVAFVAVLVVSR